MLGCFLACNPGEQGHNWSLWQTGHLNQKISELFGMSYSSVSRRVGIFREKLRVDKIFKKEYDGISVLIKM